MMFTPVEIIVWIIVTLLLARLFYNIGMWRYAYILTDRRLKGFPNYNTPNVFRHGSLTSAETRVVPYPTPHALHSICIYDVRKRPLSIRASIPDGVYWSITFSARNQDCFFTLNDLEAKEKYGREVEIALVKPGMTYLKKRNEIVVTTPRLSQKGLILIRIIVMDPGDSKEIEKIAEIQKMATAEEVKIG